MPIDNEKPVSLETLQRRVVALEQVLLSMTGIMRHSTDEKVQQGVNILYRGVKRSRSIVK